MTAVIGTIAPEAARTWMRFSASGVAVCCGSALTTTWYSLMSERMVEIFRRWFGPLGRPSMVLEAAYTLGSIPE